MALGSVHTYIDLFSAELLINKIEISEHIQTLILLEIGKFL